MTYWMDEQPMQDLGPAMGLDVQPKGFFSSASAATSQIMRDWNANNQRQNELLRERESVWIEAAKRMPEHPDAKWIAKGNFAGDPIVDAAADAFLEEARARAAQDPDAWKDLDLSDEGIERRVKERRVAERAQESNVLAAAESPVLAQLTGGLAASVADIRQLPLFLLGAGAGSSIFRVMAAEALAGAAGAAITLPSEFKTAKEFGLDDPNIAESLAIGAAGGAIIGGGVAGLLSGGSALARGMEYYRGENFLPDIDGMDIVQTKEAFAFAELAIARGNDPIKSVADNVGEIRPALPQILPDKVRGQKRTAIVPDQAISESAGLEPEILAGDAIPLGRMAPPEITDAQNEVSSLTAMLDEAKAAAPRRTPLIDMLKSSGRVTAAQARKNARLNAESRAKGSSADRPEAPTSGALNVDPTGPLGQELIARGITPKTAPGLFRKGGIKNLDTQVASEMEDSFPGIMAATGTRADDTYIDEGALIDLIGREFGGDITWLNAGRDLADITGRLTEAEGRLQKLNDEWAQKLADGDVSPAIAEYMSDHRADRGFFVNPEDYANFPDPDAQLAADLEAYLVDKWDGIQFTDPEKEEIVGALAHRGGEADLLIDAIFTRNAEVLEVRNATDTLGESAGPDRPFSSDFAEPEFDPSGQGRGGAELEGGAAPSRTSLTDAQRTEIAARQQQSRIRRLDGNTGDAGPLFDDQSDMFGASRSDLFSDPTAPEAQDALRGIMNDLRADESLPIEARMLMDDIDADEEFQAILDACKGGNA